MANTTITYYKTDPVYTNEKFMTHAVGKKGFFTTDVKKTIGLTGKEVDNNFLTLEGRDIYDFYFDERKNLTIETLNGDKYTVSFLDEIRQPDWTDADIKSVSYIRNKPESLSDFKNDSGFTRTTFQSLIYPENKKDVYEIGIIAVDNKQMTLYGKVFRWAEIETVDAEYDERLEKYIFNISENMFESNKVKNYLLYPFYDDMGTPVDIMVTYNHSVFLHSDNAEILKYKAKWMDVILDEYKDSDVYYQLTPSSPVRFSCTMDDDGQRYVYIMPMNMIIVEKKVENYLVSITNANEDETVVTVMDVPSEVTPVIHIYSGETTDILYPPKSVVKLSATDNSGKREVGCNWSVTDESGTITTYEDMKSISFSPSGDVFVKCSPVEKQE